MLTVVLRGIVILNTRPVPFFPLWKSFWAWSSSYILHGYSLSHYWECRLPYIWSQSIHIPPTWYMTWYMITSHPDHSPSRSQAIQIPPTWYMITSYPDSSYLIYGHKPSRFPLPDIWSQAIQVTSHPDSCYLIYDHKLSRFLLPDIWSQARFLLPAIWYMIPPTWYMITSHPDSAIWFSEVFRLKCFIVVHRCFLHNFVKSICVVKYAPWLRLNIFNLLQTVKQKIVLLWTQ